MGPAALLNILVNADTGTASTKIREFDAQYEKTAAKAAKGIEARLGGNFNSEAFKAYEAQLDKVQARTRDRAAFKAELGASFNPSAFNAYQRGLKTTETETTGSASRMKSAFLGAGKAATALVAAYLSVEAAKSAIEFTTNLAFETSKLSAATGLDTKTASSWIEAMKERGVQSNALAMGFITLERNIRNATDGSKASKLAFEQLGVPMKDIKNQGLEKTINQIADAYKGMNDPVTRAAIAQQLFGRNAKVLIPILAQGHQGIDDLLGAAQRYGAYIDDKQLKTFAAAHEAQMKLNLAMDGFKIAFTPAVLPSLVKGATALLKFIAQMRTGQGAGGDFAKAMRTAFDVISTAFQAASAVWKTLFGILINEIHDASTALQWLGNAAHNVADAFSRAFSTIEKVVGKSIGAILGVFAGLLHTLSDVVGIKVPLLGKVFGGASDSLDKAGNHVDALRKKLDDLGQTHKKTADDAVNANQKMSTSFDAMSKEANAAINKLGSDIKSATSSAVKGAAKNFAGFTRGIGTAMDSASNAVGQGVGDITSELNQALKAFNAKTLPSIKPIQHHIASSVSSAASSILGSVGIGAAQGALFQFGRQGDRGRDTIPVNFGGTPVMVGSGEMGAVLTGQQQKVANALMAPIGGLAGLFRNFRTPHYASHGINLGGTGSSGPNLGGGVTPGATTPTRGVAAPTLAMLIGEPALPTIPGNVAGTIAAANKISQAIGGLRNTASSLDHRYSIASSFYSIDPNGPTPAQDNVLTGIRQQAFDVWSQVVVLTQRLVASWHKVLNHLHQTFARLPAGKQRTGVGTTISRIDGRLSSALGDLQTAKDTRDQSWIDLLSAKAGAAAVITPAASLPVDNPSVQLLAQALTASDQAYAVSQAQYNVVGAFAAGGITPSTGWALVGENGPELAKLPGGTRILNNNQTSHAAPIAQPHVTFVLDEGIIDRTAIKMLADGQIQKAERATVRRGTRPLPGRGGGRT